MHYNYKYRLNPSEAIGETLLRHVDTCRQLYNHVLYLLNEADDIPARYEVQRRLPDLKTWWDDLGEVHSKVLQMVVKRVYDNLSTLKAQKENGRAVGMLKWKPPGVSVAHLQSVRLRTQEYEWSACPVVEQDW